MEKWNLYSRLQYNYNKALMMMMMISRIQNLPDPICIEGDMPPKVCYLFLRWKKIAPHAEIDFKILPLGFWAWEWCHAHFSSRCIFCWLFKVWRGVRSILVFCPIIELLNSNFEVIPSIFCLGIRTPFLIGSWLEKTNFHWSFIFHGTFSSHGIGLWGIFSVFFF